MEFNVAVFNQLFNQGRFIAADQACRELLREFPGLVEAENALKLIAIAKLEVQNSAYSMKFTRNRRIFRDFPRLISIETTGLCNANCLFCPHGELPRRTSAMTEDLFEKILNDLRRIPDTIPVMISPNLINEPFLDNKIIPRLARINAVIPHARILIYTNLNIINDDLFDRLASIDNLISINVSFNAANKNDYEKTMGINFERTVKNIRGLLTWNRKYRRLSEGITLSRVTDEAESDRRYIKECEDLFIPFARGKDYSAFSKVKADMLGAVNCLQSPIPYAFPCGGWHDINVMCDGTVPHCCQDVHGNYALGDVTKSSLLDIYNGPFRKLRETATSRENVVPCNQCALLQ